MAAGNQHITDIEQFRRYVLGALSYEEQHRFEKRLMEDALFRDAFDGFLLMNSDGVNPKAALTGLDSIFQQRVSDKARRFLPFWTYATAASVVLVASWFIFFSPSVRKEVSVLKPKEPAVIAVEPDQTLVSTERSVDSTLRDRSLVIKPASSKKKHKKRLLVGKILSKENQLAGNALESKELTGVVSSDPENTTPVPGPQMVPNTSQSLRAPLFLAPAKSPFPDSVRLVFDNNQVRGRVVDGSGQSIPGVTIRAFKTYAVTDSSGDFSIRKPFADSMSLSFIGYKRKTVAIDKMNLGEIRLEEDQKMLSEVVVVGYGTVKRKVLAPHKLVKPSPVGGWSSYRRYLHQKAPGKVSGKVKVTFMVRYDGSLSGIFATGDEELTKTAIEVVRNGPSWQPATGEYPHTDSELITVTVDFHK